MTLMTKDRWRCDWCGTATSVECFGIFPRIASGWKVIYTITALFAPNTDYHFCREAHRQLWLAEREKVDA